MTDKTDKTVKDDNKDTRRRRTRSAIQAGTLSIPEGFLPQGRHHRWFRYEDKRMFQARALGYEPVNLRDRDYQQLRDFLGDGTAADSHNSEAGLVIVPGADCKMIFMECPVELYQEGLVAKTGSADELEHKYNKSLGDGFKNPTLTQTVDVNKTK